MTGTARHRTGTADSIAWEQVLDGVDWFHVSGITPAISQNTLEMTRRGIQEAKKRGITVSFDYNYRENLWKYGVQAEEALRPLSEQADVLFASEYDLMRTFGLSRPDADSRSECCRILARQVLDRCPSIRVIAATLRTTHSAEDNSLDGPASMTGRVFISPKPIPSTAL